MKIFIDPGHNFSGEDTGAQGNGIREQYITFIIANKLKSLLISEGHEVFMSRNSLEDNVGSSLSDSLNTRVNLANRYGVQLLVSIHCNAFDGKASGTETLVYSFDSSAFEYAERIQKSIVDKLGTVDRGVKERKDLAVLRKTTMPALLVETAFIDNASDAKLLINKSDVFAEAIFEGITGIKKEKNNVGQTIMKVSNALVQEINPYDFGIMQCKCDKKNINLPHYANGGFQATKNTPVGNLAINGNIITQAKDNADDINLSKKKLTTIYTLNDSTVGITKTDDLSKINNLKNAISGIPIIVDGKFVDLNTIKAEGYYGNELYNTWHGFLGIRGNKLVHIGAKCGFDEMCWLMVAFGIYDAIKLDGGGSFIEKSADFMEATPGNREINNVIYWNE